YSLLQEYGRDELKDRLHLELLLSKPTYHVYFALNEERRLVGCALIYQTSEYIWLDFLAITKKFQRQGYGQQLMQKVFEISDKLDLGLFVELLVPEGYGVEEERARVKFVEKAGCLRLDFPYKLASEFMETNAL